MILRLELDLVCTVLMLGLDLAMYVSNASKVEKILDKRTQKGGYTEYLVKWRNYEVILVAIFDLYIYFSFNICPCLTGPRREHLGTPRKPWRG